MTTTARTSVATSVTPLVVELGRESNLNDVLADRVAATPDAVLVERKATPDGPWQPLTARDIAETILWCAERPRHVNIQEVVIYPTVQASPSVVSRKT